MDKSILAAITVQWFEAYLKCVLPREALIAVVAREGLDSQMDPLVSLQVVVSIEALWTLVTLEWPVVGGRLLMRWVSKEVGYCCGVAAVEAWHHARVHTNQRKLTVRVLDIGKDRCWARLVC